MAIGERCFKKTVQVFEGPWYFFPYETSPVFWHHMGFWIQLGGCLWIIRKHTFPTLSGFMRVPVGKFESLVWQKGLVYFCGKPVIVRFSHTCFVPSKFQNSNETFCFSRGGHVDVVFACLGCSKKTIFLFKYSQWHLTTMITYA